MYFVTLFANLMPGTAKLLLIDQFYALIGNAFIVEFCSQLMAKLFQSFHHLVTEILNHFHELGTETNIKTLLRRPIGRDNIVWYYLCLYLTPFNVQCIWIVEQPYESCALRRRMWHHLGEFCTMVHKGKLLQSFFNFDPSGFEVRRLTHGFRVHKVFLYL